MDKRTTLAECPAGLFLSGAGELCVKTEYSHDDGRVMAYIVRTGEAFQGGARTAADQLGVVVEPVSQIEIELRPSVPEPVVDFCRDLADEIERAAMLHPGPDNPNMAALAEEVGEVSQALLGGRSSYLRFGMVMPADWEAIRIEAIQVAAMAFRIAFEGDPSLMVVPE